MQIASPHFQQYKQGAAGEKRIAIIPKAHEAAV
jgi:hypothetical protein